MRMQFEALLDSYVSGAGLPKAVSVGVNQYAVSMSGFSIHIGLFEERGMLMIHAGVALLPQIGKEALYIELLQANNLFSGTNGLTLGVDPDETLVTLQAGWPMAGLTNTGFTALFDNFLFLTAEWMHKLSVFIPENDTASDERGTHTGNFTSRV